MFLTTKTNTWRQIKMTYLHITLKASEIQSLIENSVKDEISKHILTTVFNQLMEEQRTQYIQANEYERTGTRISQRNGYDERSFTTRIGTLELKVPRTREDRKSTRLNSSHVKSSYA